MKILRPDTCDPIGDYDALYDQWGYETERCSHAGPSDIAAQLLGDYCYVFKWIDCGVV